MRDEFRDIVAGWMLVDDVDALQERINRAAEWTGANGPLRPDEEATVRSMIETVIAGALKRGDFTLPALKAWIRDIAAAEEEGLMGKPSYSIDKRFKS